MRLTPRRRGFTLVELLVVIGIIALLISILLPALNKARETAVKISCGSQIRQVGILIELYRQNHKGTYPPLRFQPDPITAPATHMAWGALLKPYLRDPTAGNNVDTKGILYCPAVEQSTFHRNASPSYVSYGYNRWGVAGNQPWLNNYAKLVRTLRSLSSQTLVLVDIDATTQNYDGWYEAYCSSVFRYVRHGKYANILFADNHVESWTHAELAVDTAADTNKAPWFGNNCK